MDAFIQSLQTKTVQERLCTEPKDQPQEALRFAIAFEEGIGQQNILVGSNEVKAETILAVGGRTTKNPCPRCGLEFSQNNLQRARPKPENVETVELRDISIKCISCQEMAVRVELAEVRIVAYEKNEFN